MTHFPHSTSRSWQKIGKINYVILPVVYDVKVTIVPLGEMTLEFPRIRSEIPKNEVENRFFSTIPRFILSVLYRYLTTFRHSWGVLSPNLITWKHYKQFFQSQIFDHLRLCLHVRLGAFENMPFHGLQNMFGTSSIWTFWVQYCRQNKFIHSLEASPFRIFN